MMTPVSASSILLMISVIDLLLGLLLGLLRPQEGQILADGVEIQADFSGWLSRFGYIPQMITYLHCLSVFAGFLFNSSICLFNSLFSD